MMCLLIVLAALYRNVNPANGSGTRSGVIQYGTGVVELDSWTPNIDNRLELQSLTTTTDLPPINKIAFEHQLFHCDRNP